MKAVKFDHYSDIDVLDVHDVPRPSPGPREVLRNSARVDRTERTERAFALFYAASIGSGAIAPIVYGLLGDRLGIDWATLATAMTALAICPFAFVLAPHLAPQQ
jgi:hypothetical protein